MSGRRSHSRVKFGNARGVLRISRDVLITRETKDGFVAMSSEPGVPGDVLTIAVVTDKGRELEAVRVMASCPVVVNGFVRHELRVERFVAHAAGDQTTSNER